MKSGVKIILGIIATIFLGAIGSGLWERFLSKFIDALVSLSIEFIDVIFKSYKDGIYETASLGFHENHSLQLFILFVGLLPFAYIRLLKRHPESKRESSEFDNKARAFLSSPKGFLLIQVLTLSVMISCLFIMSKISYTNRVITYSMRSLDIIKPYITNSEQDKLVSQFYQVRNTDDYDEFNKLIRNIAENNSLRLPKNAPLQ